MISAPGVDGHPVPPAGNHSSGAGRMSRQKVHGSPFQQHHSFFLNSFMCRFDNSDQTGHVISLGLPEITLLALAEDREQVDDSMDLEI